ncbi:hypothetical protein LEP1GSC039_1426 [Leptospira santarosai str. 2000027870]|nr:hypothetical protein LEP1GSC039_1426 [Leptospira santarosai str. 2000027870]
MSQNLNAKCLREFNTKNASSKESKLVSKSSNVGTSSG